MRDLDYAMLRQFGDIVNKDSIFLDYVEMGDEEGVRTMLESLEFGGANINARDLAGHTVLMIASSIGHFNIVKYLVKNGADVNLKDESGKTALDYVKTYEIRQFLINAGAKTSVKQESALSKILNHNVFSLDAKGK